MGIMIQVTGGLLLLVGSAVILRAVWEADQQPGPEPGPVSARVLRAVPEDEEYPRAA